MLVVTFHTTADAFAFEKAGKKYEIAGRLTTIPRSISAGCGLAWSAPDASKKEIEKLIQTAALQVAEIHLI